MNPQLKRSILKRDAKHALMGCYGVGALTTLLVLGSSLLLNYLTLFAVPVVDSVFTLILELLALAVTNILYTLVLAGMYRLYLNLVQRQPVRYRDLLSAFQNHPEPIAAYSLLTFALQYGMLCLGQYTYLRDTFSAPLAVLTAVVGIAALWFTLTYHAVLFLHAWDPWRSTRELMRESRQLMSGNRLRFLLLQLSFLGVLLLAVLSLGIGMLFVFPYITVTDVLFCLRLLQDGNGQG